MMSLFGWNEIAGVEVEGALVFGSYINWAVVLNERKHVGEELRRDHF